MKFKFRGKFKLKRNEKCKWQCKEGRITQAKIIDYELLFSESLVKIKNKTPKKFNSVTNRVGKHLIVTVNGDKVNFRWGKFSPVVVLTEALTPEGCKKWPKNCGEDFRSMHVIDRFCNWIKDPWLPLKDELSELFPGADRNYGRDPASREIVIQYTYNLKRLK